MPYAIIAGINENAAVLHHHQLNNQAVKPRSFLIDAEFNIITMPQISPVLMPMTRAVNFQR